MNCQCDECEWPTHLKPDSLEKVAFTDGNEKLYRRVPSVANKVYIEDDDEFPNYEILDLRPLHDLSVFRDTLMMEPGDAYWDENPSRCAKRKDFALFCWNVDNLQQSKVDHPDIDGRAYKFYLNHDPTPCHKSHTTIKLFFTTPSEQVKEIKSKNLKMRLRLKLASLGSFPHQLTQ